MRLTKKEKIEILNSHLGEAIGYEFRAYGRHPIIKIVGNLTKDMFPRVMKWKQPVLLQSGERIWSEGYWL